VRLRRGGRARADSDKPIEAFWEWWASSGRAAAEAGIDRGAFGKFTDAIAARVKAIHPGLVWELGSGAQAKHALVVTAAGVPEPRRLAERWYQQAPPSTAVWEYHPARQASPGALAMTMDFAGERLDLTELLFDLRVDNDRRMIDAIVFHPSFTRMPGKVRGQVGFLALDWALGEDGVVRWIGRFDTTDRRPAAAVPVDGLIDTVQALASRAGGPSWALLVGEMNGAKVIASLAVPAKWVDHPLMDQHIAVSLPFADQTAAGFPAPSSLDQLREFEDKLTRRLPPHALLVAHETSRGVRTLHLYADSDDVSLAGELESFVSVWPGAVVKTKRDAGWEAIGHLTSASWGSVG